MRTAIATMLLRRQPLWRGAWASAAAATASEAAAAAGGGGGAGSQPRHHYRAESFAAPVSKCAHAEWGQARSESTTLSTAARRGLSDWGGQPPEQSDTVLYPPAVARIGAKAPGFQTEAVIGNDIKPVSLADYLGKWTVLVFYPKDFTFVCPTEIIAFSEAAKRFRDLNAEVLFISTDTPESHLAYVRLRRSMGGLGNIDFPILADVNKTISAHYGVLLQDAGIALRGLFIINPEGVLQQVTVNNLGIGRSVDETVRLLQAYQFFEKEGEVCPANWKPGDKTMVADPEESLAYFESMYGSDDTPDEAGGLLPKINSEEEYHELIQNNPKLVVKAYAPWCGKCKQITPLVDQLVDSTDGVKFVKLDTEAHPDLTMKLNISSLPAFHFFKDGKEALPPVTGYKKRLLEESVAELAKA